MSKIEFKKPFTIGEEGIVSATVVPLLFARFVELSRKVVNERRGKQKFEVLMQRERLIAQTTFHTATGKDVRITSEAVAALPAGAAKLIVPALTENEGVQGKILSEGDGINTAILYQFGTPIKAAAGAAITEVEFLATTYGEIEEVLAGTSELYQAMDLISLVAKPVGGTLMSMPSWAIDQITLADGVFIANKILPSFLE